MHLYCFIDGPLPVKITTSGGKALGETTLLLPGSSETFVSTSECYPACTYMWTFKGKVVSRDATFSMSSASMADDGVLVCEVINPEIKNTFAYATTVIEMIGELANLKY